MKGKIVSYDSINGVGKIIIKNEGVKLFSIDNWIDYDNTPTIGMEIECRIDKTKLVDIRSLNSAKNLLEELEKDMRSIPIPNLKIKGSVSIDKCLGDLFGKYKKIALKHRRVLKDAKSLPYKNVKNFIITAYNNLLEIDHHINDKSLMEVKDSLDEIEYYYDDLLRIVKSPIYVNLEKFVLTRQKNYSIMKKRFDSNKDLSVESIKRANLLELEINKLNPELEKITHKSDQFKELENKIKAKKRRYVDLIDTAQNLKEENELIADDIRDFENVYKNLFEKFFKNETDRFKKILEKEMNILAYKFDTFLWENAKSSKEVQEYFEDAKIEGSYSTKTFMKYYLKNLDNNKMSDRNKKLLDTLDELTVFSKNILICDSNANRTLEIHNVIENIDHDANVEIIHSLKDLVLFIKENDSKLDIVIVEVRKNTLSSIEKIMFILKKLGVHFLLYSRDLKRNDVVLIHSDLNELKKSLIKIL